jgi:acetyl esterase/lipase
VAWWLLVLGGWSFLLTVNALVPRRGRLLLVPSFVASWLTVELAFHQLAGLVVLTGVLVALGALDGWPGWLGLGLAVASAGGLLVLGLRSLRTTVGLRASLGDLDTTGAPRFPLRQLVVPVHMRRREVRRIRDVPFARAGGRDLRLDVYLPREEGSGRPCILQIHGGAWVLGDKREQGIPLLTHLAANGWVGFNANYRLGPHATFPDQLVDLKRAVAWIREHAAEYGGDPGFLAVTGGSAGGHLCALVALTRNDPEYQPGFEQADTSVQAAVPFYGVYDFTNRFGTWAPWFVDDFLRKHVMKASIDDDREAYEKASPLSRVRPDAPPFLVVHGDVDTLAPVADARSFVDALRKVSRSPVLYAEMKGAQHAFEVFPSFRTARVIEAAERFLHHLHDEYLHGRRPDRGDEAEAEAADQLTA